MPTVSAKQILLLCASTITLSALLSGCQSLAEKNDQPAVEIQPAKVFSAAEKQQFSQQASQLFEEYSQWQIEQSPVLASQLGVAQQFNWDDISLEAHQKRNNQLQQFHQRLTAIDEQALDKQQTASYQTLLHQIEFERLISPLAYLQEPLADSTNSSSLYRLSSNQNWLLVSQDILLHHHAINNVEDAHDYIDRVEALPQLFKRWQEWLQWREQQGVISEKALLLKNQQRAQQFSSQYQKTNARNSELWQDFNRKVSALSLYPSSEKVLLNKLYKTLTKKAQPAYKKLADELERLASIATEENTLSKQPQGMRYYQLLAAHYSQTELDAHHLFQQLSEQLINHQQQFINLAQASGFAVAENQTDTNEKETQANTLDQLPQAFAWLEQQAQSFASDDPELTRQKRRGFQRQSLQQLADELPYYLAAIPQTPLDIHTIYPTAVERQFPTFNSHDILLNNMMYGTPGQFIQIALADENPSLPEFRNQPAMAEFNSGWRLYAIQLAAENSTQQALLQLLFQRQMIQEIASAITDLGLHGKSWPAAQATSFLQKNTNLDEVAVQQAIREIKDNPAITLQTVMGYQHIVSLLQQAQEKHAHVEQAVVISDWLKLGAVPAFSAEQYLLN